MGTGSSDMLDMVFSPTKVFRSFLKKPAWWPCFIVAGIIPAIANGFIIWRLGFERIVSDAMVAAGSIDAKSFVDNALEHENNILMIQSVSSVLGTWLGIFAVCVLLWLALLVLDSRASFKQDIAVISYTALIVGSIKYLLVAIIVTISPDGFHINNPLATSAAFFLDSDNAYIERFYLAIDALGIVSVLLAARGLQIVSGKLSFRSVLTVVGGFWVLYNGIKIWSPWL
jgi:hypothetical protein